MHRSGTTLFTSVKVGAGLSKRPDFYPATPAEWKDAAGQALRIFNLLQEELIKNPDQKIGLLYAANNDQALALHDSQLTAGNSIAAINGSGQALLFAELVKLINKNKLMDRIHILPMSTSKHGGNNTGTNAVSTEIIDRDINYVEHHIKNGFTVYGMPRRNKDGSFNEEYAIGGGVSKAWVDVTFPELGGKTQNEYLQEKLNVLEKKYHHAKKEKTASVAKAVPVAKAAPAPDKTLSKPFEVPAFKARFKNNPKDYVIKITDHQPVVMDTAAGLLVSLNIWCPGSAISPSLKPPTAKSGVLAPQSQRLQMVRMARFLFGMAKNGVVGFMLQEIPDAKSNAFQVLNNELAALCKKYNTEKSEKEMPINLQFQHWTQTPAPSGIPRGVCALVNVNKLNVTKNLKPQVHDPVMNNRFATYCVSDKENPDIQFDLYNIHADFAFQPQVAKFVGDCVKKKAMVCGDLNISARSPTAKALKEQIPDGPHNLSTQGEGGTLDCFFDAYTPSLSPKVKPEDEPAPKAEKTLREPVVKKTKLGSALRADPKPKSEPLTAHESVLKAEPEAEPKTEAKAEVLSYLDTEQLKIIREKLTELKWSVVVHRAHDGKIDSASAKKGNESITIAEKKFITQSEDVETFKAMLEAFRSVHPDKAPRVKVEAEALIALWEQAYKAVYAVSTVPVNFVRIADAKKVEEPAPTHASPRP